MHEQDNPLKTVELSTEQNYNMIDGVLNNAPTMSELEARAKAGEQISLLDVAEKEPPNKHRSREREER